MIPHTVALSKIYFLHIKTWVHFFVLQTVLFPLGMVLFIKAVGSPLSYDRLVCASLVMTISMTTINSAGFWVMADRFQNNYDLILSLPLSTRSYFASIITVSVVHAFLNAHILLLAFAVIAGVRYSIAIGLIVLASSAVFSWIGVFLGMRARNTNQGALLLNLFGTGFVLMSPVFYPVTALPPALARIATLLPHAVLFEVLNRIIAG